MTPFFSAVIIRKMPVYIASFESIHYIRPDFVRPEISQFQLETNIEHNNFWLFLNIEPIQCQMNVKPVRPHIQLRYLWIFSEL